MANRPPFLCELDKGRLIDAQPGFVDTFNWSVRAIDNLKGGTNCEVVWPTDDHPVINVTFPETGSGGGGGGGGLSSTVVEDVILSGCTLSVEYTDGTAKRESLPDAVSAISREPGPNSYADVLSVSYLQAAPTTVDLGIVLSGTDGSHSDLATQFKFASRADARVSATIGANNTIYLGVYYV